MTDQKDDIRQNLGTLFLMIMFSLFLLTLSDRQGTHYSESPGPFSRTELVIINNSGHPEAAVFSAINIPGLYKEYLNDLHTSGDNLSSLNYKLSHFNLCTARNFENMQKTRLVIGTQLLWRLYHPAPPGNKDDSPV